MKKLLFLTFLLIYSFNSSAHMAHYNKFNKIEMEILRDGEVIGYNYYFFKKDEENTTVTNQLKFTVKLFGATIFEVESFGEEKYNKDKLISFNSKTRQNKKDKYVQLKLNENENAYDIKGSSYTGSASLENIIGNWWSHKILQTNSQISVNVPSTSKIYLLFCLRFTCGIDINWPIQKITTWFLTIHTALHIGCKEGCIVNHIYT